MRQRVVLALAITMCWGVPQAADAQTPARILVMPFENLKREGRIFWLGEASAVLLADDLNALGANAITRPERRRAFERVQVPPTATLTDATVIRIGQLVGASEAIIGTLQLDNDVLIVRARSIALQAGRVEADVTERGSLLELFAIFERVARRVAPRSAKSSAEIEGQYPAVAAFEDYIKGLLAETPDTAIAYLNSALKIEPTFDRARLALWDVYTEQGDHARALTAAQSVPPTAPLKARARFLAGLSELNFKKNDEAFATFKALADVQATPPVLNNLGIAQLRLGSTPQAGLPTYYFTKAAQGDPDDPDYYFNLGYAYWQARDAQAAIYWLREVVRRTPADGDAHYVLGAALAAVGNAAEAAREKELARRLSSAYEQWDRRPAADAVPKGLERVKTDAELPHAGRIEAAFTTSEQRDQQELARFYLDRGRRLFSQENDREAVIELNHALYLSPYLAEAHLLLGRVHMRSGRLREAVAALQISLWSAPTADAHAALGETYRQMKDLPAARAEAERALALDPKSSEGARLRDMLKSP